MKNTMAIVTRNMKRKTMTSYNQRLPTVIINVEGFKDLHADLHHRKLYSKEAYSESSQASEIKLLKK